MKKSVFLLIVLVGGLCSMASDGLAQRAMTMGLKPIPASVEQQNALISNKSNALRTEKIELGKMLYFEPRLSMSGLISCNTCHNLGLGGVDGIPAAIGHKWTENPHHLNSPTVYNAVFNKNQFWDGRSPDLEDQATGPIQAGPEMAMPGVEAVRRISTIAYYQQAFAAAFPVAKNPLSFKNIGKAIAAFERTLITPSRYDAFLLGDEKALTAKEQKGFETFLNKGCTACHTGMGLGGTMMQRFPLIKPYPYSNVGDFKGDANGMVKVPLLRNIEETAPYFHNGAVWTLEEAIAIMGRSQLGIELTKEEISDLISFMNALTGDKPKVEYPQLPPGTHAADGTLK